MRVIPDDIERAATHVCESVGISDSHARKVIAAAILAERKRCADVARERVFDDHALAQATDVGRGCHLAASEIVEAIEAGA